MSLKVLLRKNLKANATKFILLAVVALAKT